MFKVGDKVCDVVSFDNGLVVAIHSETKFAVKVKDTDTGTIFVYDKLGFAQIGDIRPSLHHKDTFTPASSTWSERLPDLPVDAPILVSDCENTQWLRRHFKEWVGGKPICFQKGCTSFTTRFTDTWNYWKLPENSETCEHTKV